MAVWVDPKGEQFFSCPMLFISDDITEWYKSYLYSTEIGGLTPYHDQASKWVDAWLVYRAAFNQYQSHQMEKKYSKKGGADDLDAMGAHLMRQKRGR